ncbi:MAG: 1-acyl-sn-glycerol-3-phosphate acyltransferase [Labilithrix sp.]|nr:1-acyl-sn-glycerol-3-phosphate acyltransferase [Labilithrix sp.]MCW5817278.1 1-acyl-sn-glycerol-3-phosphate acyltransferase [Labilithrix sp.]
MSLEQEKERWARRAVTVPGVVALWLVMLATLPALFAVALVVDLARPRSFAAVRVVGALFVVVTLHVVGLAILLRAWVGGLLRGRAYERRLDGAAELWFAATVWSSAIRIFGMRVEVEGAEVLDRRGPAVVMTRHASLLDVLLPLVTVCAPAELVPHIVAKRELLWDPCVDLVGHRVASAFVHRGGRDRAGDLARVAAVARACGRHDALVLFPEGTRFSDERRAKRLAELAADPAAHERALRLEHVLPPRLGGPLATLEAAPPADVIFCAHTGLERARTLGDLLSGALVGETVRVHLWRVRARDVPTSREERIEWLWRWWEHVDAWITRTGAAPPPSRSAPGEA